MTKLIDSVNLRRKKMTTLDDGSDGSHPSDAEKDYDLYLESGHKNAIV